MSNYAIVVVRSKVSYMFKRLPDRPDDWGNNDWNNSMDTYWLYRDNNPIFACRAQTMANLPGIGMKESIAPGTFRLKLFQDPRDFQCPVHGIVGARTLGGNVVNESSVSVVPGKDGAPTSFDRYLDHDWQKHKHDASGALIVPPHQDTRVAWSAGCLVKPTYEHGRFCDLLRAEGFKENDEITVTLKENGE